VIVTAIAYVFPIEQYENFLLTIGSVFVPVYTIIFLEYLLKGAQSHIKLNIYGMLSAAAGTLIYFFLTKFSIGIPTVLVMCTITILYFLTKKIFIVKENSI
jgi:purine-cytosine permease-like protein